MAQIADVVIDDEFAALGTPLTDEERLELQKQIEKHGFRDRLVVWLNHNILLDGHNRHRIWQDFYADDPDREPEVIEYRFANRDEARDWVIRNQLGRRNLSEEQKQFWRGKLYNSRKGAAVANLKRGTESPNGQRDRSESPAATQVAAETGVSERTIRRDGKFADAVDRVADPEVKHEILSGRSGLTRKQVELIADAEPEKQKQALADLLLEPRDPRTELPEPSVSRTGRDPAGVMRANEAINALSKIPKNDPLRERGFQIVSDWIKKNRGPRKVERFNEQKFRWLCIQMEGWLARRSRKGADARGHAEAEEAFQEFVRKVNDCLVPTTDAA